MTFPKARLVVSACLFVGWIGFLLYLVIDSPGVIVSKPQLLVSSLFVSAEIHLELGMASPEATIDEVIWCADDADKKLTGQKIRIRDLAEFGKKQGFKGAGRYLVPLLKRGDAGYQVTPLPTGEARIYPMTERVRRQAEALIAARK